MTARRSATRLALLGALALACASPAPRSLEAAPELAPGARIELGSVSVAQPLDPAIDAVALLGEALREQLGARGILADGHTGGGQVVLHTEILRYEPGDAFKRWLLPGYGATILAVRGRLVRARDGATAGRFEHERGVYWGGLYTVGQWRRIFGTVAADIARDLDRRIHRRGFTVELAPWSARAVSVPEAPARRSYGTVAARDLRADRGRIGTREAAFGVSMGDVFFAREIDDYLAEAVADQLRAAGHQLGVEGAPPLDLAIEQFRVHTDTTPLYWDVVGEIALTFGEPGEPPRRVECRTVERTYVWPSERLLGAVLDRCLVELMAKLVVP